MAGGLPVAVPGASTDPPTYDLKVKPRFSLTASPAKSLPLLGRDAPPTWGGSPGGAPGRVSSGGGRPDPKVVTT